MGRPLLIVALVGLFIATGVAGAAPAEEIRLPIDMTTPTGSPESVVVKKGDHLWKISERHVVDVAPDQEVGPYWRQVVDLNTPSLRSGDPDLIYPGEVVELPPMSGQP